MLFLSIIPLLLNYCSFEVAIILRIILCSCLIIYLLIAKLEYIKLKIKNPLSYQILTNINYFGTLFILSLILDEFSLKLTYILFQLGFAIILKYYDLKIRNIISQEHFNSYFKYIGMIVFFIPIVFIYIKFSFEVFILYYLSVIFFLSMKYKFLKYEKN